MRNSLLDIFINNSNLQSCPTKLMPLVDIETSFHQPIYNACKNSAIQILLFQWFDTACYTAGGTSCQKKPPEVICKVLLSRTKSNFKKVS